MKKSKVRTMMKPRKMRRSIKILGVWVSVLLLTSLLMAGGVASAERERLMNKWIYTERGATEAYGGGNYYLIAFGTQKTGLDAAFGVIWGTEENPNSIMPFAVQARYLGVAQVYDDNGNVIEENYPIKVYTFYGLKLETILEFNDTNGDGICNFIRDPDAAWWQSKWEHEPIYNKRIDLNTAWTVSKVSSSENKSTQEKSWQFTLTAINQAYKRLRLQRPLDEGAEGNVLEKLEFTFHLRAKLVEVDGIPVPQFNVTITDDPDLEDEAAAWPVLSSERMEDKMYTGKKALYGIKWDHEIDGWDFNPNNQNKSLLMEFRAVLGNFIPATTTHWFRAQFMQRLGEDGRARYRNENGMWVNSTADDPEPLAPRRVRNRIEFEGNWSKVGRFTWASNVTVDGQEKEMYAQVQAGIPFALPGRYGRLYSGFALIGGLSYPGGDSIYHDPGIEGEMTFDISSSTNDVEPKLQPFSFIVLGLLIVAVVAVVIVAGSRGKGKRPEGFENSYDRYTSSYAQQDWSQYYERKR